MNIPAFHGLLSVVFGPAAIPVAVGELGLNNAQVYVEPYPNKGEPRSAMIVADSFVHGKRFAAFAPQVSGGPLDNLYFMISPHRDTWVRDDFPLRGWIRSGVGPALARVLGARAHELSTPVLDAGRFRVFFEWGGGNVRGEQRGKSRSASYRITGKHGLSRVDELETERLLASARVFVGGDDKMLGGYRMSRLGGGSVLVTPTRLAIEFLPIEKDGLPSRTALRLFQAEDWKRWIASSVVQGSDSVTGSRGSLMNVASAVEKAGSYSARQRHLEGALWALEEQVGVVNEAGRANDGSTDVDARIAIVAAIVRHILETHLVPRLPKALHRKYLPFLEEIARPGTGVKEELRQACLPVLNMWGLVRHRRSMRLLPVVHSKTSRRPPRT